MSKYDNSLPNMEDVAALQQSLEAVYPIVIVVELRVNADARRPQFTLIAKAYTKPEIGLAVAVSQRAVSYPSNSHKTFPGALVAALYDLEQQLQAWYWLNRMGFNDGQRS